MLLDVSADHLRRDLVTYRTSTIAIFPEFSAPQAPLPAWERTKDSPGTQTLAPCHDWCDGVSWWEGAKERDMVRTHLHFLTGAVILLRNISKALLDALLYLALPYIASILGRPDQVVESIVDGVGCASEDHAAIVPPQPVFGSGHRARCQRHAFPPAASSGAASAFFEQLVESLEKVERDLAKKHQGYAAKPKRPRLVSSYGHHPQAYSVDDVVKRIREEATAHEWAPSRATVYNWITKGHRWYGKIDVIRSIRGQPRITEQGRAQVYMIVQAKNRCDKLRNSPGMTADNLKKLYQRYKKPDGTPDLDAIEGHVARRSRKSAADTSAKACPSLQDRRIVVENYIADLEGRRDDTTTRAERESIQEELDKAHEYLRQLQEGSYS